jgi:hypothetical protein
LQSIFNQEEEKGTATKMHGSITWKIESGDGDNNNRPKTGRWRSLIIRKVQSPIRRIAPPKSGVAPQTRQLLSHANGMRKVDQSDSETKLTEQQHWGEQA